jgi:imidazoleglycerol-phosphate dehydratase
MPRKAKVERKTKETDIRIDLSLDSAGKGVIKTGIGFFDHMLNTLARHSFTVEDVGLCLGQALREALGDKTGIQRFGFAICPMDEALTRVAIDLSGRPHFVWEFSMNLLSIGDFRSETIPEFFQGFAIGAQMALHMDLIRGRNLHHAIESLFKSFALALRQAVTLNAKAGIPSTKGTL